MRHVKKSQQGAEVKILVGAGPRGETFARAVHRKGAKIENFELFLKELQTRYGNIQVYCDQQECFREVAQYSKKTGITNKSDSNSTESSIRMCRAACTSIERRRGAEFNCWCLYHVPPATPFFLYRECGNYCVWLHSAAVGASLRAISSRGPHLRQCQPAGGQAVISCRRRCAQRKFGRRAEPYRPWFGNFA